VRDLHHQLTTSCRNQNRSVCVRRSGIGSSSALSALVGRPVRLPSCIRTWSSENAGFLKSRFLHALNYCMVLPGPEAQQLATYIGWLMHRTWGGIIAGVLLRLTIAVYPDRPVLGLHGLRQCSGCGRRALWHQARGHGHRRLRRLQDWLPRTEERMAVVNCSGCIPRYLS
jgi:heme A synthase